MRLHRLPPWVVPCVAALLWVTPALAQTSGLDKARDHFAAGRKHRAEGRCDLALEDFSQALELEPNKIGPNLNLGDCYAELGRFSEAFPRYKEAERLAELANDERRLEAIRTALSELEAKMVRVVVRLEEPLGSVYVHVDGVAMGTGPWHILVTPGVDHEIRANAADGRRWNARARGDAGAVVRVMMAPASDDPPRAPVRGEPVVRRVEPARSVEPSAHGSLRPLAFVVGGVGAAGIVTGIVSGALALDARSDLAKAVDQDPRCRGGYPRECSAETRGSIEPVQDRAQTMATVSTVTSIVGAAFLVAGGALYLLSRAEGKGVRARLGPRTALIEGTF